MMAMMMMAENRKSDNSSDGNDSSLLAVDGKGEVVDDDKDAKRSWSTSGGTNSLLTQLLSTNF